MTVERDLCIQCDAELTSADYEAGECTNCSQPLKGPTMTYQLIVMSFDGDYKTESPQFENTDDAWSYAGDLGSKWFFYPFHFVVDQVGEVVSAPLPMEHLEGLTIEDVASHFREVSKQADAAGVNPEEFAFMV